MSDNMKLQRNYLSTEDSSYYNKQAKSYYKTYQMLVEGKIEGSSEGNNSNSNKNSNSNNLMMTSIIE